MEAGSCECDYLYCAVPARTDCSMYRTTTTSGNLNLIDLTGQVRSRLKVHGGMSNGQEASGVVRDVAVTGQADDADSWRFVSVGYDGKVQVSK
jgi:hypothetical protein